MQIARARKDDGGGRTIRIAIRLGLETISSRIKQRSPPHTKQIARNKTITGYVYLTTTYYMPRACKIEDSLKMM